jgi:hypothetical protein
MMRYIGWNPELFASRLMSPEHTYVYKACQIVMSEVEQQWTYCVMFDDEHYEPYPPRAFDCEEDALKAATDFATIESITLRLSMDSTDAKT